LWNISPTKSPSKQAASRGAVTSTSEHQKYNCTGEVQSDYSRTYELRPHVMGPVTFKVGGIVFIIIKIV
jgi:hypothetical protein